MKRDMKLVKEILGLIEHTGTLDGLTHSELMEEVLATHGVLDSGGEAEEALVEDVTYQLGILESGGLLLRTEIDPIGDRPDETYYQLTWAGHDYLDESRSKPSLDYKGML
ncbi:DUF2513 domain-containing protein [Pseudomonas mosselii]|uniref:DUF2513 domain-containing protein n=1 Tax=Pseudomonas peradeniyensis TaxID=2745488 RepID=A0A923GAD4_9PSED|nr:MULTISPECIES: DUF2513 domain-containing protein [Pseudomonas]MBV4507647.1 DUF2513 domain-containing protein [Pseudomonas peradeniyensis]MDH1101112.1 DUF2513 domain-containing protein [Pseudomonas mosselii]